MARTQWRRFERWVRRHPIPSTIGIGVLILFIVVGAVAGGDQPSKPAAHDGAPGATPASATSTSRPIARESEQNGAATALSIPAGAAVTQSRAPTGAPPASGKQPAGSHFATALLATLTIKGRAPKTGYSRAAFGAAWTDDNDDPGGHNGCRTRDDILARDLTRIVRADGCKVTSGVLIDPYTGKTINFVYGVGTSTAIQIDHVVALSNAWQTGAQYWDKQRRIDLANDPLNLLAVDGPSNESKGDGDAATWLPPNKAYRCAYVARQVAVKAKYGLWVTPAEHDAIARILSACPGQQAPDEGAPLPKVQPHATAKLTPKPASKPVPHSTAKAAPSPITTSAKAPAAKTYANCTDLRADYPHGVGRPGAVDHTSAKPVTQFYVSKALYEANIKSDRDKDGIACEH